MGARALALLAQQRPLRPRSAPCGCRRCEPMILSRLPRRSGRRLTQDVSCDLPGVDRHTPSRFATSDTVGGRTDGRERSRPLRTHPTAQTLTSTTSSGGGGGGEEGPKP